MRTGLLFEIVMNLLEIKQHLSQVKIATLSSLCVYFNCEAECLRAMLSHWIKKGKVRTLKKTARCGVKCMECNPSLTEIYEWM